MDNAITLDKEYLEIMHLNKQGYCCSQIMTIILLRSLNKTNEDLVRAMAGLCNGVGGSGGICGCLSGGTCLISLCTAKGCGTEASDERLPLMLYELTGWFRERTAAAFGDVRCDDILTVSPDKRACIPLIAETYRKVVSILEARGFFTAGHR
jgi:C_GCAxxG_C_C family probable redox protein